MYGIGAGEMFSEALMHLVSSMAPAPTPIVRPSPKSHFNPSPYDEAIHSAAEKHGVHPELVKAVIDTESNWKPHARSGAGAYGLMQLMPIAVQDLRSKGLNINPKVPEQNIEGGTKLLADLIQRYGGNVGHALAAYNAGPARFNRTGRNLAKMRPETREYVSKVLGKARGII
jgi:soluble lytic murein transglycosylase-like protein